MKPADAPATLTQVAEYNATAAALSDLKSRYGGIVLDVSTREGMVTAIKGRAELRGYRTSLEKLRVELKAPALERSRLIDAEAKRITAELSALEDPLDEMIKSEETRKERERAEAEAKEAARVAAINDRIVAIDNAPARLVGMPSGDILTALEALLASPVDATYAEFEARAIAAKERAEMALRQLYAGALAQEQAKAAAEKNAADERAELDRLRKESEARQRQDDERRAAIEKEQQEARERIAADAKAAQEKREREDAAAQTARDKADAEAREAREAAEAVAGRERERIEADRREVTRLQNELIDGDGMLTRFVERFGKRAEFASVVQAIAKHFAAKDKRNQSAKVTT